jgi:hypothetical protein
LGRKARPAVTPANGAKPAPNPSRSTAYEATPHTQPSPKNQLINLPHCWHKPAATRRPAHTMQPHPCTLVIYPQPQVFVPRRQKEKKKLEHRQHRSSRHPSDPYEELSAPNATIAAAAPGIPHPHHGGPGRCPVRAGVRVAEPAAAEAQELATAAAPRRT